MVFSMKRIFVFIDRQALISEEISKLIIPRPTRLRPQPYCPVMTGKKHLQHVIPASI
jgi:hypothetical protein